MKNWFWQHSKFMSAKHSVKKELQWFSKQIKRNKVEILCDLLSSLGGNVVPSDEDENYVNYFTESCVFWKIYYTFTWDCGKKRTVSPTP